MGYLAYRLTKLPVPANRLLLFAPLAMLGVLGAIAARSWIDGRAHLLGAIVLIALVGVSAAVSAHEWLSAPSWLDPVKMGDAEVAVAYLTAASVGPDRPVVFLVDDRGPLPAATVPLMRDEVFDVLPVDRIRHAYVYVGSPQNYLAARPTLIPGNAQYNRISERLFRLMRSTYGQDPVAIIAASFNQTFYWRWEREHPVGRVPGHGVSVLRGPPLPRSIRPAVAPAQPQAPILGAAALSMLGLFGITGLGWLLALFGPRLSSWERMLAAPAAGLAVLVLGGALFDGIGVRLSGVSGALIPLALAVLGWGSYFLLDLRRRSRTPSS